MELSPDCDPIQQVQEWLDDVRKLGREPYPEAACLSTLGLDGYPDGRIVLVRGIHPDGFVFYTNSQSTKGQSIAQNPRATLTFYWLSVGRQVRITGDVSIVSESESDAYFNGRPVISRLGAWASHQSQPLGSRQELEARVAAYEAKFGSSEIPRPPHWFGYKVTPIRIELWSDGEFRLHDRFRYNRTDDGWSCTRLNP
ncbi:pyridoxamine 5'-phosphate oxidase [bacterium]|nr:pyridoxamine 5'-phosphate oxidase [bacterium]